MNLRVSYGFFSGASAIQFNLTFASAEALREGGLNSTVL